MKVNVYWRKYEIMTNENPRHEVWEFRSGGFTFSCPLYSVHKRRRPERIFLGLAQYRPMNMNVYVYQEMRTFKMEERKIHNKTLRP